MAFEHAAQNATGGVAALAKGDEDQASPNAVPATKRAHHSKSYYSAPDRRAGWAALSLLSLINNAQTLASYAFTGARPI